MNFLLRASRILLLAVAIIGCTVFVAPTHAAPGVRANVTYQARLMDASGYPVADGVYQVEFSLYDAPVAGNRLWTADGTVGAPLPVNVTVQDGLFTVLLGDGVTQLPFGEIDWNSDSLYLGVTIGADGEMSPRRPITAVPQAINSAQLGGMSPSSTDTYGGESQFTILQASTTAATSTRSALDVRSNGTSVANDFILRALTNTGSPAFTITSQGVVSTTNLLVTGQNVCLADGTNCITGSEADTLATVTARGSTTTVPLTFFGGITAASLSVTGTSQLTNLVGTNATFTAVTSTFLQASVGLFSSLDTSGLNFGAATGVRLSLNQATSSYFSWTRATGNELTVVSATFTQATTTNLAASLVSTTQLFVTGKEVCLQDGTNCSSATTTLQAAYTNGRFLTLNDGRIQLEGVTGAQDEFSFNGLTATPILGAGYAGATNTGFDLSLAFNGTSGTFFSFTDNRNDPGATVNTSYLVHIPGNDNTLLLGNATSFIQFDNDIVDITNGSNEIFLDQGQQFFTADSDITGDTPFYFQDIGSQSSLLGLSNSNGLNLIHLGSDINPNGVYIPEDSGDLLIRSGSTGGAGTQLYVNVDGTDTGWRGVATTDMLAGSENLVSKLSENLILGDSISYIDVEGRMAFVIYSSGEWGIVDVTEPGQMVETYHQFGSAVHGQLVGKRLYVVDSNGFVEAYDVSDPTNASFLGDLTLPDPSYANNAHIVVEGSTIYFASDNYFVTIDARDPATMAVFADSGMPPGLFEYTNLIAQDGILYFSYKQIGNPDTEIAIFDVNDPVIFDSIGSGLFTSESQDDAQMAISDNRFYIKRYNGAEQVIDVYRTTNGMVDFGGGPLTTLDPSGDAIDHFEVYRGRVYVAAFIEGSTQKLFETFTANFDGTYSSEQMLTNAFQTSDATDSPAIFNIEGAFAYGYDFDGVDQLLGVVDLGGMTTRSLRATNGDFGQLTVANDFTVRGAANFTNGITVDGRGVCLSDGSNCVSTAGDAITSIGVEDTNFDNLFIDAEGGLMFLIDDTASSWIYEVATREDGVTPLSGNGDAVTGKLVGDRLFLVDTDGSLAIRDLTDPNNPVLLGGPTPITGGEGLSFDSGAQIEIEGNIAYFTATNTLRTIDISDPANISVLDSINFADGDVRYPHIAIMDGVLYFASKRPNDIDASTTLFEAYNVQDPSNILLLGDMTQSARDRNDTQIAIMDRKIYFIRNTGTGDRLRAHSVATGFFGASIITLTPPVDSIGHFEVYRGHVYLSGYDEGGLQHQFYSYAYDGFDYTLEQTIKDEVGTYDDGSSPANFDIDGSYLYGDYGFGQSAFGYLSLSGTKSRALSASNGEFGQMVIGDELSVQGFANFANGITVDGRGVCLSDGTNCVGGAGFSLAPMTVTSTVGTGFGTIYEVESDGGTLLVRNQLYDLSDPRNPVFVNTYASIPDSVSIQGSKLFGISTNVDGTSTLMSYDIRDLANPTLIADADLIDISAGGWAYKIEGSLLYYADDDAVSVYDIKDLSAPVLLGTVALPGAYSAPWIDYKDGFVYYTAVIDPSNTVIAVIDVRNPAAPTVLTDFSVLGSNNVAYYPKVVISDRRAYFSSRTTDMVVKSYDITDPANPVFLYNIVPTYGELHDFEVVGTRLYISAHSVDNADRNFERWNVASNSSASFIDAIENSGNENFVIAGGYAYLADSPDISVVDLGGLLATNIAAATADFGQLSIGNGGISVRGQSDFQNGLTVNGVGVCLSDGTNCPVSGGGSLQASYDLGKDITLNNGHIELASVTGTNSDVYADNFSTTFTRMMGGGVASVTTTGFDILGYDDGVGRGVVLSFSLDRDGASALAGESYLSGTSTSMIRHGADEFSQFLQLGNNTTSLFLGSDYIGLSMDNGSNAKASMSIGSDGTFGFEADGFDGVDNYPGFNFFNSMDNGPMISLANDLSQNVIWLANDVDPNQEGYIPTSIADLLFNADSTSGSGTQLYVNVDGTNTGWRGLATVDMLTGGSGDLQSAYDNGKVIVTSDGAIELIGSATATIVGTTDIPLLTATFVSGTNEGLDLALFSNSAVPLWSGTGTGMFYRHDQTIDVTNTTSSGLAFSDDGVQSYATLYTKQTGIGSFKYVTLDNSGIDISPGSGGTTTFMDNVALNSSARFDSSILPRFTNTFGLGNSSLRWNNFVQSLDIAGTVTGDLVPSANLTYDLGSLGTAWNEAFIDTVTANTIGAAALTVGGQNVCLLDGTNCPVTSLSWVYDGANGLVRLTTSSNDIVLGASATSTGAPVYLETNQTVGTSTLFIGYSTSANLIIGGTSSTMSHMHSLFSGNFNGNDLYVGGNIGSASSVYTLGEFVVGTGSFKIGNGTLTKTDGAITVSASNGFFLPATDLGISLGSLTQRFNGYFNNVTSTNATTSNLVAGNVTVTSTLTASSVTMFGGISQTLSSSTQVTTEYSAPLAFSGATSVDLTVSGDTYFMVASTGTFPLSSRSIVTQFPSGTASPNVKHFSPAYADGTASLTLQYDGTIRLDLNSVYTTSTFDLTTSSVLHANGNLILVGDKTKIYTFVIQRGSSLPDTIAYVGQTLVSATAEGIISIDNDPRIDGQFVISYYDAGATRLRRYRCLVPFPCLAAGSASNGISASPVEVRAMGGYYYAPIPETNSVVRFSNTGSWVTSTSYVMGDAVAKRISANNGYLAVVGQNLSVIDTKTNTRKTLEGVVGTSFSDVEMIGDTIIVVSNLGEYQYSLGGVRAPGAEFGTLTVGSAGFDGDVYAKQSLKVGSGISVLQGGMDLQGGLTVGRGNAYISGSLDVNQHAFFGLDTATDTAEYRAVISYSGGSFSSGLCLDDSQTIDSCPTSGLFGTSLLADGTISASAFDLAEMYDVEGPAEAGDVLVFNQAASARVEMSGGTRYDRRIAGVVSTRPGLLLGWAAASQTQVALAGRVPTKISMTNGEIKIGDPLTTSEYPGYAMKATKPGMILGYALEDLSATGTIEVFVDTSYNASAALGSDGTIATVTDNLVMVGAEAATATTTAVGSYGLTFHGEGWDTTSSMSLAYDFTLRTDMLSSTNSRFVIENNFGSSTFSVDQEGIVRANGYEVNDAFDLAERYESADQLEPGDLVMISKDADRQILRTNADEAIAIGVISTKAGFTLGANASGTFPVALAGRVPTKVTTMGGAIQRGDALMASTIPGVAQKATVAGQIIGYALENYEGDDNGLVEVFIQPGLWIPQTGLDAMANAPATGSGMGSGPARQGFAKVTTGGSRVSIKYTSILAYPVPQVTAMGNVSGGWWLENVSDVGFDIVMDTIQPIDIQFAWQVSPAQTGIMQYHSDGTYGQLDPLTGQLIENPEVDSEEPVIEAPVVEESAPEVITEGE